MVIIGSIFTFMGYEFMEGNWTTGGIVVLKYYTIQTNIFIGVIALVSAIYELLIFINKKENIPLVVRYMRHISVCMGMTTMLMVVCYLGPVVSKSFAIILMNCNLFFHLLVPLFAAIALMLFEPFMRVRFRVTFFNLIPLAGYSIFYSIVAFTHYVQEANPHIESKYDWYGIFLNGIPLAIVIFIALFVITFLVGLFTWFINRQTWKRKNK